jgi:hypothetical protein
MPETKAHSELLTELLDAEYLRSEFGDQSFRVAQVARGLWPNLVPQERAEGERRVAAVLRELQDAATIYRVGSAFRVSLSDPQASPEPAISTAVSPCGIR